MNRTCKKCGSSRLYFNTVSMKTECKDCGAPAFDDYEEQQQIQFERTYAQAEGHISAGNWERAIQLLRPLMDQQPKNKALYQAAFRAATHNYEDVLMENGESRTVASAAWDTLSRLNGITADMVSYGNSRYERHRTVLKYWKRRVIAWLFIAVLLGFCCAVSLMAEWRLAAIAFALGVIVCGYVVYFQDPFGLIRQLLKPVPDSKDNPFFRRYSFEADDGN